MHEHKQNKQTKQNKNECVCVCGWCVCAFAFSAFENLILAELTSSAMEEKVSELPSTPNSTAASFLPGFILVSIIIIHFHFHFQLQSSNNSSSIMKAMKDSNFLSFRFSFFFVFESSRSFLF